MIHVTLKNYDTGEILRNFSYKSETSKKKVNAIKEVEDALKFVEEMQKTEDVLGIGEPCHLKHEGFALGIMSICANDFYQNSTGFNNNSPLNPQEPILLKTKDGETIDLRIAVESYQCGLVLNTGTFYTTMLCTDNMPAYFEKINRSYVTTGARRTAKVYDTPNKLKKALEKKEAIFKFLTNERGYKLSVEYTTKEFQDSINDLDENKKKRWEKQMQELDDYIEFLNKKEFSYETNAAEEMAKYEESGECGERPAELTEKDFKPEAIKRMNSIGIPKNVIKSFEEDGRILMCSGIFGTYKILNQKAEKAIRLAKEAGVYPYLAIQTTSCDIGTITDLLYVSSTPSEWENERNELLEGFPMSCCVSDATFGTCEFGSIGIKRIGDSEGIVRNE